MTAVLLAEISWPAAVMVLGLAWAVAFAWWVLFWALTKDTGASRSSSDEEAAP